MLLTYFGLILHARFQGAHPSVVHAVLPAWDQWDTRWYENIARRGYDWRQAAGTAPAAFFPLYPLLIHSAVWLTHRSYLFCALAISNLAFLAALIYLWKLTRAELGTEAAGRTLLYIAVFPTALFFFAGYTESLFLLLTVACFYHLRRGEWWLAGLLGGLAAGTRVTGVLLVLPFAYEYAHAHDYAWRRLDLRALAVLLVPAGLVAFAVYLHFTVGDPLAFTHDQVGWQKIFTPWLGAGALESLRQILLVQPAASFFQAWNVINLGIGALMFALSIVAARRLPMAYGLYLAAFWLLTLSSPALASGYPVPLVSMARYVLTLFPVFMVLGVFGSRPRIHDIYLVLATGSLALLTVEFISGAWVV